MIKYKGGHTLHLKFDTFSLNFKETINNFYNETIDSE